MSLGSFLLRRLGSGVLAILGVTILVFAFLHLVPGDPIDNLAGGEATPEQRAKLEHCLGLDASAAAQLTTFLGHVVDGTLGHQCPDPEHKPSVAARIASVMPHTIALAGAGMLVAVVLALPLGVLAAVRRGTWIDTVATVTALSGIVVPMMLLASLLVLVFFAELGWFPGPTETGPAALVLPALAVGTHLMAMLSRMTRSSMIAVLGEDYVRTARAKGLSERAVLVRHVLRNALLPFTTAADILAGYLFGGSVVVEQVFALPGLGRLMVGAIAERDYALVQAAILLATLVFLVVNACVDMLYAVLDPRLRA